MTKDSQDTLARAYATLKSLRSNIDKAIISYGIPETYVREYHAVLDRLENIEIEVSEFRIPDSEVTPRVTVVSREGARYTDEKYVDRSFILTKIDAILGYFEIITSEKPKKMGFSAHQD